MFLCYLYIILQVRLLHLFFDKILQGLGFEGEEKNDTIKKPKREVRKRAGEYTLEPEKEELIEEITPKNQDEVARVIDYLKKEGRVIVCLAKFSGENRNRTISFLSGALYALGGEMTKDDEDKFKLVVV